MRLIKHYGMLKDELIESLEARKGGNEIVIEATKKYLPQNQADLDSLIKYGDLLNKLINFVKEN